jgi:hypothetical protein
MASQNIPAYAKKRSRVTPTPTDKAGSTVAKIIRRKPDGALEPERIVSCNRVQHRAYKKDRSVVTLTPVYATDDQFNRDYNRMGWDRRTPAEKLLIEVA